LTLVMRVACIAMVFFAVALIQNLLSSRVPATTFLLAIAAGVAALLCNWRPGSLRRASLATLATVLLVLIPPRTLCDPRRQ